MVLCWAVGDLVANPFSHFGLDQTAGHCHKHGACCVGFQIAFDLGLMPAAFTPSLHRWAEVSMLMGKTAASTRCHCCFGGFPCQSARETVSLLFLGPRYAKPSSLARINHFDVFNYFFFPPMIWIWEGSCELLSQQSCISLCSCRGNKSKVKYISFSTGMAESERRHLSIAWGCSYTQPFPGLVKTARSPSLLPLCVLSYLL